MWIKILKDHEQMRAGELYETPLDNAKRLISLGVAEEYAPASTTSSSSAPASGTSSSSED